MNTNGYQLTVGLEIHVELKTKTKMFCRCLNDSTEKRPNVNICPVCTAQPGALPVINKEAVRQVLRVGVAVGGDLADFTEFDRKNYFYPDIPKGYQISQYQYPLVTGGNLSGVKITRVHLEEDTAKSFHEAGRKESLVDFNRSSLPLMELVTEPVIHDAKTAGNFAKELQLLLRYLGASEANMEQGQMRVEANISVSKDPAKLGTKVEVKNLNSFRSVEKAIEFEMKRQIEALEKGEEIVQETCGWDENKQVTFSQRKKESSHDYRYFPDPDLPKLFIGQLPELTKAELEKTLPELPWQRRERLISVFGLKSEDVEMYVADDELGAFIEEVAKNLSDDKVLVQLASNYLTSDVAGKRKTGELKLLPPATDFADLIKMVSAQEVSSRGAKDILLVMVTEGGAPKTIAEIKGLFQIHDEGAVAKVVDEVIAEFGTVFAEYQNGKEASLQFLIGQGMKKGQGATNPETLKKLFIERAKK
ncbi:MAG: glutaminyl-tRNA synthase (glutamine-hydrolyzing) subunit B [Candidatus Vogelbacteria bacterium RIFOXYB1_FULL_42_16]|uniref:Aspartyl/glutamyl-tRNA(Asn/Gln) amidotransferase subunit B n=1 Tax=Candidatus Vogelbacteria bacterium RIFOXYB1_FULL_42_16 TaxID=1802436 RepID=A0A1G2QF13_9BACT|nr:MAG: Aspartyl/glutamyl-tRNA(Asn/Gln) amidotransferase subunit B [Parcubacteria group bacterium GW2011_GWB1_42_9]OHA59166.1 MAG: glutaminyl-tRNA synthase (glutamine-hydrolyzing) subunit B [Candidatus Vogelbacteria bacterium RIFOXYB1_FULL_42_16]